MGSDGKRFLRFMLFLDCNDERKVNKAVDAIDDTTIDRKAEFKAYYLLDLAAQNGQWPTAGVKLSPFKCSTKGAEE
jgi:hypothetical protein